MMSKIKFLGLVWISAVLALSFTSCGGDDNETVKPGYEQNITGNYVGSVVSSDGSINIPDVTLQITAGKKINEAIVNTTIDLSLFGFPPLNVTGPLTVSQGKEGYVVEGEIVAPLVIEGMPIALPIPVALNGTIVEGNANIAISVLLSKLPIPEGMPIPAIDINLAFVGETAAVAPK
ncbi:hypothetical protein FACS189413_09580 [Bacteroidia bacterium]|nr:hypothetical protein FACS189413_09580 [Bacteroidia bacterium]